MKTVAELGKEKSIDQDLDKIWQEIIYDSYDMYFKLNLSHPFDKYDIDSVINHFKSRFNVTRK